MSFEITMRVRLIKGQRQHRDESRPSVNRLPCDKIISTNKRDGKSSNKAQIPQELECLEPCTPFAVHG